MSGIAKIALLALVATNASAESRLDSTNYIDSATLINSQNLAHNILSLRADSQNLRGNPQGFARAIARSNQPPIENIAESQGGLPRAITRARNDEFILDSATLLPKSAESAYAPPPTGIRRI